MALTRPYQETLPARLAGYFRPLARRLGFDVVRHHAGGRARVPPDIDKRALRICESVHDFTMTSEERICALVEAVDYLTRNGITGALVECGVWKGGSAMAMALALLDHGDRSRTIYLYDTYAGMTAPTAMDVSVSGEAAGPKYEETKLESGASGWCYSNLDEVRTNILSTGYAAGQLRFVEGPVEQTIPGVVPQSIALLRLDTDWYESTKHELEHLYPLLVPGGVLLIDDYGHWQGCRQAVDEYFADRPRPLFARVDGPGRIAVKLP